MSQATRAAGRVRASPGVPPADRRARRQYRRGALLIAGATLAWSSSGLITRIADTDAWTTLFWRSVFACPVLLIYLVLREGRGSLQAFRGLGLAGWGIAVSFAVSMLCFIVALKQTSVAHVLIFQAASPLFAGILAWAWLGEKLSGRMVAAIALTACGVGIMVSASLAAGRWLGDLLSALMAISFSLMVVLARADRRADMIAAACLATALAALVVVPWSSFEVSRFDLALLALFGIGQMGLALVLFTAGVRLIPAADAGLISVLEAVLAPLWAWLAVGENPGLRTMVGGAIVVGAVVLYGVLDRTAPST
ncbi:MAG: DMT family transporter [Acidisphaera sp.]|nr:DMT family transporter [Acidisphaera sp.]